MSDKIWYDDLTNFITYDNYHVILPFQEMTLEEKLNAILRSFIYLGIILALVKNDYRYIFFGLIAAFISIVIYKYEITTKKVSEQFLIQNKIDIVDNKVCTASDKQNPFMNVTIADIGLNPTKPEACSYENERIKDKVNHNFDSTMFHNNDDVYNKKASQRQFYSNPVTTVPNDQGGFAEYCFGHPSTCKDGSGSACYGNISYMRTN